MITVRPVKNAETAKSYYTEHLARSEYYSEGTRTGVEWFGKGCTRLGLEPGAEIAQEAFERLCDNLHPLTGEKLTVRHRNHDRRVCYDFTVNPTKGVSVMAELGGDSRLIGLHESCACTAINGIEELAGTRVRRGGSDGERPTRELVAARVTHRSSRALDPQLHTHFVVFNATWDPVEKRWKALQTREMFEQINLFTEIYRSEMAAGLRKLGYDLRPTANGFEIAGIPEELLERFSKRRKAIQEAGAKLSERIGKPVSNNARATLAQTTRDWKDLAQSPAQIREYQFSQLTETELLTLRRLVPVENPISPDVGQSAAHVVKPEVVSVADAKAQASDHPSKNNSVVPRSNDARTSPATHDEPVEVQSPGGIRQDQRSAPAEGESATLRSSGSGQKVTTAGIAPSSARAGAPRSVSAADAVSHARDHLFERKSVVPRFAMLREAMAYGHGDLKVEDIEDELARRPEFVEHEETLTTREMIRREQEMLALVNSGIGQAGPINSSTRPESPLNREQRSALGTVMNSPDLVVGIRGVAGSGKTELLRGIAAGVEQAGRKAVVLAPTGPACDALRQRGLSWSSTVQNFLASPDFQQQSRGAVVVVDEAGLLSVGDMLQVLKVARTGNCRVVLCGDTRQHTAVEAGDALRLLEERSAMQSAGLLRNHRQTTRGYREAIEAFASGNGIEGLSRLDALEALHEVDEEKPNEALVAGYVNSLKRGKSALIVSPTWREIRGITEDVRVALKVHQRIGPEDTLIENHTSLSWTRAQKRDLRNYRKDMVLRFHRNTRDMGRGESLRVQGTDETSIIARKGDGTEIKLTGKQADCFDVLEVGKLPVAAGEILLLKGNLKAHGLINGKSVQVRSVRPDGRLDLEDGRTIPPEFRTFTHGYCVTSMAAQGRTVDHVYVSIGADSLVAANLNQFYVSASRGREQVQVFTDDIHTLRSAVRRSGNRLAAVELSDRIRAQTGEAVRHTVGMTP